MNVCVVGGAGYVGLVTGLGLSEIGHHVIAVDVDQDRIRQLHAGESPIYEEGLQLLLETNLAAEHISFSTDLSSAVAASEIIFITVGTPLHENGQVDLSQVVGVMEELGKCIDGYKLIVVKSTVPVGTVELVQGILKDRMQEGSDFDIVVNPEFLREGSALLDFFYPDRLVIGTRSERARAIMRQLYEPVIQRRVSWKGGERRINGSGLVPLVETDPTTAQMIKYASNAFLAARISFVNEIAELCELVGSDISEVTLGMGYDPRIGHTYLEAGLGFGGPCLEKDLRALMTIGGDNSQDSLLLRAVLERNQRQVERVVLKLKQLTGDPLHGKSLAVFGIAYKAGTDDTRNSLALRVIEKLEKEGACVRAHDPRARNAGNRAAYCEDPYLAVQDAHALLVLTGWPCFAELDYRRIKELMASPCILDARNLLNGGRLRRLGFEYIGIGTL